MRRPVSAPIKVDYGTAQAWYHIDQGTAFFPYAWLIALEQAGGQERFTSPGNMERFGFLSNPPHHTYQPRRSAGRLLAHRASTSTRRPSSCWPGEWVGLTCAACHTGEIRYHGSVAPDRGRAGPERHRDLPHQPCPGAGRDLDRPRQGAALRRARLGAAGGLSPAPMCRQACDASSEAGVARARVDQAGLAAADEPPTKFRLRPPRCARARRQLPVRREHRHPRQLQADHRAGELPGPVGHALSRLGAVQRLGPPAARTQHRRGAGRRRADRSVAR